jgi:hypothetical protein
VTGVRVRRRSKKEDRKKGKRTLVCEQRERESEKIERVASQSAAAASPLSASLGAIQQSSHCPDQRTIHSF